MRLPLLQRRKTHRRLLKLIQHLHQLLLLLPVSAGIVRHIRLIANTLSHIIHRREGAHVRHHLQILRKLGNPARDPWLFFIGSFPAVQIHPRLIQHVTAQISQRAVHDLQHITAVSPARSKPQITEHILCDPVVVHKRHRFPRKKRNAPGQKLLRQIAGLPVGAVEHRHLPKCQTFPVKLTDLFYDRLIFLKNGRIFPHRDASLLPARRRYTLVKPIFIVGNQRKGCPDNPASAPVIFLQTQLVCTCIIPGKMSHQFRPCTAELVDGLVIVAHKKQLVLRRCQKAQNLVLQRIHILHLIHQYVPKLLLPDLQVIGALQKQLPGHREHIVKIDESICAQLPVIGRINIAKLRGSTALCIIVLQRQLVVFDRTDFLQKQSRQLLAFILWQAVAAQYFPHKCIFHLLRNDLVASITPGML